MKFNADGEPVVRTHVDGISLQGDVIVDTVSLSTSTLAALESINVQNTVSVTVSNFPTTSTVYQGTSPWTITGTVSVSNFTSTVKINTMPAVSGTVTVSNFTSTVSISNTVTIANTSFAVTNFPTSYEVSNDVGNPIPISRTTATNSVSNPLYVEATVTPGTGGSDAFGRQRVSEPFTLGDYKHIYGLDPNFLNYTTSGATVVYQSNQACARLTTTNSTTSRAVHQSKFYHHYMPGKSQLILSSINFYNTVTNVTKRTGYFDDRNGIYFEQAGNGTLSMCIRSYVSGTAVDTKISQYGGVYGDGDTGWNGDKIDGSGSSAWTMQQNKTQLWWCDFQWLGVGRVRVGFVHQEKYIVCHTFYHSDNLATVYMSNPDLPIRCEIFNTGATTGGYIDQICSTVLSEGGYVEAGTDWSISNGSTLISVGATSTLPILAIRLKTTFRGYDQNRIIARLQNLIVFSATQNVYFQVVKLPNQAALTGATIWTDVDADSGIQYTTTATGYTTPDVMISGYVVAGTSNGSANNTQIASPSQAKKNYIVQNFDSTDSEIYAVVVTNLTNQATNVGASLQWREIY